MPLEAMALRETKARVNSFAPDSTASFANPVFGRVPRLGAFASHPWRELFRLVRRNNLLDICYDIIISYVYTAHV
jgi:hypothetical protein